MFHPSALRLAVAALGTLACCAASAQKAALVQQACRVGYLVLAS
jgi:hypothetical protein